MNPTNKKLRCLVVDDSTVYRKVVRDVLAGMPGVEVVGVARDGVQAIDEIVSLKPDLVTLDLEMPRLDGNEVLRELSTRGIKTAAIMVSAFTNRGAKATTTALGLGAFDFILKPNTKSVEESIAQLRTALEPKIKACMSRIPTQRPGVGAAPPSRSQRLATTKPAAPPPRRKGPFVRPDIVAIGISTGGPQALLKLLPKIPADFPVPIVLVQHMPPMFTKSLAEDLNQHCPLTICEAEQGQQIKPGSLYIAPGGKQMRLEKRAMGTYVQLTNDPPEHNCKPSADYLFRSVAKHYGARSLGAVLTGMGDDGTDGARLIKEAGGQIIAQDEASCVVYGMPKSVIDNGLADIVAPLNKVHDHILTAMHRRAAV